MSEYKNIIGKPIKVLSSNLDNDQAEGQIWYNSTDGAFKNVLINQAWSSAGAIITARSGQGAAGNTTAGIIAGGRNPAISTNPPASPTPGNTVSNFTEEYDGTGWTAGGLMNQTRYRFGAQGTQTANLAAGGFVTPGATTANSEEYNGTSWTEGNNLGTSRGYINGFGTQDAGLCFGGTTYPPNTARAEVEEYDGTSWTEVNNLPQTRYTSAVAGIQTAGIAAGGALDTTTPNSSPSAWNNSTVQYDGTNWTAGPNLNTTRNYSSGSGTQTSSLVFGGSTGAPTSFLAGVEEFDGTSYSNKPSGANLGTARQEAGYGVVGPSANTAFLAGGVNTAYQSLTEEFNTSVNVITGAAWASGGNLGTSRRYISGCGTQTATVAFGGFKPGAGGETELYNGSSWSEVNNLGTASYAKGAAGVQTAALAFGGSPDVCESWDGTNWTSSPAMNTPRRAFGSCGIQTAALAFGGRPEPSVIAKTEEWDGSSWSNSNDLNGGVRNNMGSGTQTAGLNSGGYSDPGGALTGATEEYDGTSWTVSPGTMNTARMASATNTGGLQTAALIYGGTPSATDVTELYDGTSWITQASMATARGQTGGGGTSTSAIVYGGTPPPSGGTAATEEFTGESSALNVKTITTS